MGLNKKKATQDTSQLWKHKESEQPICVILPKMANKTTDKT